MEYPKFWKKELGDIDESYKEFIYEQYFSKEVLTVYSDGSLYLKNDENLAFGSVSFVKKGEIHVKYTRIYPNLYEKMKSVFVEMKSLIYCLDILEKNKLFKGNARIYCDVNNIDLILEEEFRFDDNNLNKTKKELLNKYKKIKSKYDVKIMYMEYEKRKINPFYIACHNSSKRMIKKTLRGF